MKPEPPTRLTSVRCGGYDVYIGRAGRGQDGYFGNPYAKGEVCSRCGERHPTPGSTLPCFTSYFIERLGRDAEYRARVRGLRGRVLGCFCQPGAPCHGRVMADWLDRPEDVLDRELDELVSRAT